MFYLIKICRRGTILFMFGINRKIDKALELYNHGELEKSLQLCRRILKSDSNNAGILITLGNIFYIRNDYKQAIEYYQRALRIAPDNYSALINIANSCYELHRYDEALGYAARAKILEPDNKLAYIILGNSFSEKGLYDESVSNLEKAGNLDSSDPWIYNYLSQSYQKNGNYMAALSCGWKAVELAPSDDNAHHINLSYLFYETAQETGVDAIRECVELWYKKYGNNPLVKYVGGALLQDKKIKAADISYVKNIFDVFAGDFDRVLALLEYRAPELIKQFMEDLYADVKKPRLDILDLGCGTGLCGEFLIKYAGRRGVEGIDISDKMLAEAASKKLYSRLINSDIISWLEKNNRRYDLMTAADVFTYFGDLHDLFENINKSLNENGRIIFTVSENSLNKNNYVLHLSGRFLHTLNYVKSVLKKCCFEVEKVAYEKLRNEGGNKVMGYVISARKIG